jgi:hypothetical protein
MTMPYWSGNNSRRCRTRPVFEPDLELVAARQVVEYWLRVALDCQRNRSWRQSFALPLWTPVA